MVRTRVPWYVHVYVPCTVYTVYSVRTLCMAMYVHVWPYVHVRTHVLRTYTLCTYVPMVRSVLSSGTTGTMVSAARLRRSLCGRVLDWLT